MTGTDKDCLSKENDCNATTNNPYQTITLFFLLSFFYLLIHTPYQHFIENTPFFCTFFGNVPLLTNCFIFVMIGTSTKYQALYRIFQHGQKTGGRHESAARTRISTGTDGFAPRAATAQTHRCAIYAQQWLCHCLAGIGVVTAGLILSICGFIFSLLCLAYWIWYVWIFLQATEPHREIPPPMPRYHGKPAILLWASLFFR